MSNSKKDKIIGTILCLIVCGILGLLISFCMQTDIWYDEVYSVIFASKSFREMIHLTAMDVHPPLYYCYIKIMATLFGKVFGQGAVISIVKIASLLPYIGTMLYVYFFSKEKKLWKACFYGIFLLAMPQLPIYGLEIRMYSLALFFITAAFLHGIAFFMEKDHGVFKKKHGLFFFLYGVLTAYTQYYACVAIIGLYLGFGIYSLIAKKKTGLLQLLKMAIASCVLYLPWIPVLLKQFMTVTDSYWILPVTLRNLFGCIKFIFLPVSYDTKVDYILAVLMIFISGACLLFKVWKEKTLEKRMIILIGGALPLFVFFTGLILSICNRPIFVYRYLVPTLGVFWLVIVWNLLQIKRPWIFLLALLPFVLGGYFNLKGLYAEEHNKMIQMQETREAFEKIEPDSVIIANFDHVQAIAAYYFPCEVLLYGGEPQSLIPVIEPNTGVIDTPDDVFQVCKDAKDLGKKVYFFGSFQSREDLVEEWQKNQIQVKEQGSYLLERYWFNIYSLTLK